MTTTSPDWAEQFHAALKRIAAYESPERLRRSSQRAYGIGGDEAIEMAYENVIAEAKAAIKGYRRRRALPSSRD